MSEFNKLKLRDALFMCVCLYMCVRVCVGICVHLLSYPLQFGIIVHEIEYWVELYKATI